MSAHRPLPLPAAVVLAGSTFVYLVAELFPVGLMDPMSAGFGVEPATIGLLVSGYALAAACFGVPVTIWCRRLPRRTVMTGCLAGWPSGSWC
ncbi:MFS transporter [Dermacoccaceae bacterium W4C1]